MAKKKEEKTDKAEAQAVEGAGEIKNKESAETETGENLVEKEKEEEATAKEQDYNSIFDDDYVEENNEKDSKKESTKSEEEAEAPMSGGGGIPTESVEKETEEAVEEEKIEEETEPEEEESEDNKQGNDKSKDSSSDQSANKKKKDESKKDKSGKDEEKDIDSEDEIVLREEKPKRGSKISKKKILIALAVLLALFLGAFGGYLYFKNTNKPKEETKKEETKAEEPKKEETKKDVYVTADGGLNMRENPDKSAKVLILIPNGTKLTVLEEQGDWYKVEYNGKTGWVLKDYVSENNPLVYKNETYGFQLTFTEKWASYKVVEKQIDNGDGTTSPALYVGIKVSDANSDATVGKGYADMFAISVLTPAQWNTMKSSEGPQPAYIAENSKYVFVWSPSQAGPEEVLDEREQTNDILKTFKLL